VRLSGRGLGIPRISNQLVSPIKGKSHHLNPRPSKVSTVDLRGSMSENIQHFVKLKRSIAKSVTQQDIDAIDTSSGFEDNCDEVRKNQNQRSFLGDRCL
jgi:hypothetical protein